MYIKCEICGVMCPNLVVWHDHLVSRRHQLGVSTQIKLYGTIATGGTQGRGECIFLLQVPSPSTEELPTSWVKGVTSKFSRYGLVHNCYINSDQSMMFIYMELSDGVNEEMVIRDWMDYHIVKLGKSFSSEQCNKIVPIGMVSHCHLRRPSYDLTIHLIQEACDFIAGKSVASGEYHLDWDTLSLCGVPENGCTELNVLESENSRTSSADSRADRNNFISSPPEFSDCDSTPETTSCSKLSNSLQSIKTKTANLKEQLNILLKKVKLTESDVEIRLEVLRNLEHCLRKHFPNCQLFPIGSFLSRVGDKSSGLDIVMGGYGEVSEAQAIRSLRPILERMKSSTGGRAYVKIAVIPQNGIRFEDTSSEISCYLSFSNWLALRNSELISFMLSLDEKARDLVLVVRRWAKSYGLTHSASNPFRLKNYTLVLPVFVFLARVKLLPTIHQLQCMGDVEEIDGWNAGFCRDVVAVQDMLVQSRNEAETNYALTVTALELTRDFFTMLTTEHIEGRVICTLTAEFYEKRLFTCKDFSPLPDAYNRLKYQPC